MNREKIIEDAETYIHFADYESSDQRKIQRLTDIVTDLLKLLREEEKNE